MIDVSRYAGLKTLMATFLVAGVLFFGQPLAAAEDSTLNFAKTLAAKVAERAKARGIMGLETVELKAQGGVQKSRMDRFFAPLLREQLRELGLLGRATGKLKQGHLRLVLSVKGRRVSAVGVLEPEGGKAPSILAVTQPLDMELAESLGRREGRQTERGWRIERMGQLETGVLDLCFVASDQGFDDSVLAVLTHQGVWLYPVVGMLEALADEPKFFAHPEMAWPRVVAGWMGSHTPGKVWITTTATRNESYVLTVSTGQQETPLFKGIPLRQPEGLSGGDILFAGGIAGSASLSGPLRNMEREPVLEGPALKFFRDRVGVRVEAGALWASVGRLGQLGIGLSDESAWELSGERVGDRLALVERNDDAYDLVTTSASIGQEPDQLTIRRVDVESRRLTPLVQLPMEGPLVALTVGALPYEDDFSIWFVEESPAGQSTLWRAVTR